MFKNAMIYTVKNGPRTVDELDSALKSEGFNTCGATQQKSVGWVPLREEYNGLAERIAGQWFARFRIDTKSVPAQALNEAVEAKCKAIVLDTGRNPGKRERRDMRDDALLELLPRAFPRTTIINVWWRPERQQLIVGTSSQSRCDDAISALVRCLPAGFSIAPLQTKIAPQAWMAQLMNGERFAPLFDLARSYRMQGVGDEPERFRAENVSAEGVTAQQMIERGVLPVEVGLTYNDQCSFTLTDRLTLKHVKLSVETDLFKGEDQFDADCALWAGMLAEVIDGLVKAMGAAE